MINNVSHSTKRSYNYAYAEARKKFMKFLKENVSDRYVVEKKRR
jgi:hypothetical protein